MHPNVKKPIMRILSFFIVFVTLIYSVNAQINSRQVLFDAEEAGTGRLYTTDIDGDGFLDVVRIGYGTSASFQAFYHKNNYTYSSWGDLQLTLSEASRRFGNFGFIDADGDNDKDLLFIGCSSCSTKGILLFENSDGKTFNSSQEIFSTTTAFSSSQVIVADFDHDGDEDFVLSHDKGADSHIKYAENENGVFQFKTDLILEDVPFVNLEIGDLNNDDKPELLVAGGNKLFVFFLSGDQFDTPTEYSTGTILPHVADLNGDDVNDVYFKSGNCVKTMISTNGVLTAAVTYDCGITGDNDFYITDIDVDGDLDIIHGRAVLDGIWWKENVNGAFEDSKMMYGFGHQILRIVEFDANNDGYDDLLIHGNDEYIGVLARNEGLQFGLAHAIASHLSPRNLDAYQVDADAPLEVSLFSEEWAGYMNIDQNGNYGLITTYNTLQYIIEVAYKDIDGDTDADMVILFNSDVTPQADTTIVWFENVNQVFSNPTVILSDYYDAHVMELEDFDKDGDIDIAVFSFDDPGKYLRNDGTGTFQQAATFPGGAYIGGVYDINHDTWNDIVTLDYNGGVYYYENDKLGAFKALKNVGVEENPRNFDVADFDEDGDEDIVVTHLGAGTHVYRNDGTGFTDVYQDDYSNAAVVALEPGNDVSGILSGHDVAYFKQTGDFEFTGDTEFFPEEYYTQMINVDLDQSGKSELIGVGSAVYLHREIETVITSVSNVSAPGKFEIFPNPSAGIIHLADTSGKYRIRVYDFMGRNHPLENAAIIDMSSFPDGCYYLLKEDLDSGEFSSNVVIIKR